MTQDQLRRELDAVYTSLSWRLTWPLRQLSAFLRFSTPIAVESPAPNPTPSPSAAIAIEVAVIEEAMVGIVPPVSASELDCDQSITIVPVDAGLSPQEKRIFNELHSLIEKNKYANSH